MVSSRPFDRRRGFTLTETAIAMGVVGSILAVVWVAASQVSMTNKVRKSAELTEAVVSNYRSLYVQHSIDVADNTDLTCLGVNANFFPSEMLQWGTGCVATDLTTYPSNPWGNAAAGQYVQVFVTQSVPGIGVAFGGLSKTACNNLANLLTSQPDVIWENINGVSQWVSPVTGGGTLFTSAQIGVDCALTTLSYVKVEYKAR